MPLPDNQATFGFLDLEGSENGETQEYPANVQDETVEYPQVVSREHSTPLIGLSIFGSFQDAVKKEKGTSPVKTEVSRGTPRGEDEIELPVLDEELPPLGYATDDEKEDDDKDKTEKEVFEFEKLDSQEKEQSENEAETPEKENWIELSAEEVEEAKEVAALTTG